MKGNLIRTLLIFKVCFFVLIFAKTSLAGKVGTTLGAFEVSANGGAAYSMGIEVPPGIMGVVPQVAINYSSASGNGLLGLGGSLSGLSSISRCGKSHAQDGISKAVQYNSSDYFCLNGQRLILMSGVYGKDGSTYQTEIESFQKVTAKGNVAGGPAYFEVLAKGGSRLVFGKSLNNPAHLERSIDPITGIVSNWGISYLQDKYGNQVIYHYQDMRDGSARQVVPQRITYGHNANANVVGNLAVEFIYEQRPDVSKGYARGEQYINNLRVKQIQTKVGDNIVRDYRVAYQQAPVGGHSRMKNITECAGNGACLLPVSFKWADYANDWEQSSTIPQALLTSSGRMRGVSVDVNNDGHTDWVTAVREADGSDTLQTWMNKNGAWTLSDSFTPPAPIFDFQRHSDGVTLSELVDINGDGLVDWVVSFEETNGVRNEIYLNDGQNWVLNTNIVLPAVLSDLKNPTIPKQHGEFIDLNGDALPDLVISYRAKSGVQKRQSWINTGAGWSSHAAYRVPFWMIDYWLNSKGAVTGFFLDVNGDGLVDFVKSYRNPFGTEDLSTWLNTGNGWTRSPSAAHSLPTAIVDYSSPTKPIAKASLQDINGDGYIDLVQAHEYSNGSSTKKVWLNTGNGWVEHEGLAPPVAIWKQIGKNVQNKGTFVDVSNDGRVDLVVSYTGSNGSQNTVYQNTGEGWVEKPDLALPFFLTQINSTLDSVATGQMLDVNSDGRGDFVQSAGGTQSRVYLYGLNGESFAHPEVITEFADGLQNRHIVEYTPSTFGDVYEASSDGQYPNIDIAGPMMLVASVQTATGVKQTSKAKHQYFGKKANLQGRGDLGFVKKVSTDLQTNIRIETKFSQTWPLTGSPLAMKKIMANGTVLMESTNEYTIKTLFGGKTKIFYQSLKTGSNYELNGQIIDTTINKIEAVDEYANVLSTTSNRTYFASNTPVEYTSKTNTQYQNDESNWRIGQVQNKTSSVSAPGTPTIHKKVAFTYASNGNLETKVLEPDSSQPVTERYQYDAFGHTTSTTISADGVQARTTKVAYTSDGRFAASATSPLGHTAYSQFHPHFGQVTQTQSPNGAVIKKLYDEHGRLIKTTKIRSDVDATDAQDHANNVAVFHPCSSTSNCPTNAAFFVGVVDNEGESPETVYYDNRNREVRRQTQGFDGTSVYVDTTYDAYGRKQSVSKPYYKGASKIFKTQYQYDILGRVKKIITPANKVITSDYYVGRTVVTNPLGQVKTTYINGQGKPAKVVDELGQVLEYTYDAAGRLLTTIGDNNDATKISIEYDAFGRKIKQDDPDLGVWEYQYDAFGQLTQQKDAKGQTVQMEYDKLGRIVKRIEAEGVTQWQYDTGDYSIGRLHKVWNDQGYAREHQYDEYGRPSAVKTTINGSSTNIKTLYHETTDRVKYVEYPSGIKNTQRVQ